VNVWFSSTRRVAVLTLSGDLDLSEADRVRLAVQRSLDAEQLVVVDLTDVSFLDSTIVGILVASQARARATRKQVVVANARPAVAKVFRMLGLAPLLVEEQVARQHRA
jgi:anti-sigma B factor antagonist